MVQVIRLDLLRFHSIKEIDYLLEVLKAHKPELHRRGTHTNLSIAITHIKAAMEAENVRKN